MSNKLQITTIDASATQIQEPQTGVDTYGADVSLTDATGNEVAFDIQYTVNKATSGEGRGVVINQIDTASPEGLNPIFDCQKDGTSQFYVRDDGIVWAGVQYVYGHTGFRVGASGKITTSGLTTLPIQNHNFTSADVMIQLASGTLTNSSGTMVPVEIAPTYNQSSTAGATDLRINRTETAVGSGEQLFADYQIGGVSQLKFHTLGGIDFDGSGATTAAHAQSLNLNWSASSTQTSSGQYSAAIGTNNTAVGSHSFALGGGNTIGAAGDYSFVGGKNCTIGVASKQSFLWGDTCTTGTGALSAVAFGENSAATGTGTVVFGSNCSATGPFGMASGKYAANTHWNSSVIGGDRFSASGDAQVETVIVKIATTDATQTTLTNGNTAGPVNLIIPADTTWGFSALVAARSDETDGNLSGVWKIEGCLARDESSNTAIVGSVTVTSIADGHSAAWSVTAAADDTNEALAIKVTGEASTNIRWVAKVDISQVSFA